MEDGFRRAPSMGRSRRPWSGSCLNAPTPTVRNGWIGSCRASHPRRRLAPSRPSSRMQRRTRACRSASPEVRHAVVRRLDGRRPLQEPERRLRARRWRRGAPRVRRTRGARASQVGRVVPHGGEAFTVALPNTAISAAMDVMERVRQTIEETAMPLTDGHEVRLTTSIGVAQRSDEVFPSRDLLRAADEAMTEAKTAGRDGIRVARPALAS